MNRKALARCLRVIPHQREQPVGEAGAIVPCGQGAQIDSGFKEDVPRQPAHIAAPVVPYILEDVGHLQPLPEGHGQREQFVATFVDVGRVVAEQLGEHLADHAGDMVAIAIQVGAGRASRRWSRAAETPPCPAP